MRNKLGQFMKKELRYKVDHNGCWIWQLTKHYKGYGELRVGDKKQKAHRFYYEQYKDKIPKRMQLDHLCRVRACVNPEHLEIVTPRENVQRGNLTKLNNFEVLTIRTLYKTGEIVMQALANLFGVTKSQIFRIINNHSWINHKNFLRSKTI